MVGPFILNFPPTRGETQRLRERERERERCARACVHVCVGMWVCGWVHECMCPNDFFLCCSFGGGGVVLFCVMQYQVDLRLTIDFFGIKLS